MKWTICFISYRFCLLSIPTLSSCVSQKKKKKKNCNQRRTSSSLITSRVSVCSEGSPQLILTFGEDWQKVLASQTRPLFQQGLAKKDPIHNCCPIIFASSCTATTNWFMNNFSSNRGDTFNVWHRREIMAKLTQSSLILKAGASIQNKINPLITDIAGQHQGCLTWKALSRTRLHIWGKNGIYFQCFLGGGVFPLFFMFACFLFCLFCIPDHVHVKAIRLAKSISR